MNSCFEERLQTKKTSDKLCQIVSWGANSYDQLGQGHKEDQLIPNYVVGLPPDTNIKYMTGGGGHSIFIDTQGKLLVCGSNSKGELGLDHTDGVQVLTPVPSLLNQEIVKAVGGWEFTLAIDSEGYLYSWGSNCFGQLGRCIQSSFTSSPGVIGEFDGYNKIKDIAAGLRHSMALTENGCVYTWGHGKKGQLGLTTPDKKISNIVQQPTKVDIPEQIEHICCGSFHSVALSVTGNLFVWGCNKYGQLASDLSKAVYSKPVLIASQLFNGRIIQVQSGWTHMLASTDTGKVYSWGRGDYGQLGRQCPEICQNEPTVIENLHSIKYLACGSEHNLALTDDGELFSWGWNEHGICGTGDEKNVLKPTILNKFVKFSHIGCGAGHSLAMICK